MKSQAETNLIEFLTNSENLPFAVEILRLGDEIRKPVLARFWNDLRDRLESSPNRPSGVASSMQLRFFPDDRMTHPLDTDLRYFDEALAEKEDQFLSYFIEMDRGKRWFTMDYGISWNEEMPSKSSRLQKMKPVVELRELLEGMEFKEGETAIGWKGLHEYDHVDGFLADIVKDSEGLLREIVDRFWLLVKKTISKVEKANQAIVGRE